jgi:hypothetical protein
LREILLLYSFAPKLDHSSVPKFGRKSSIFLGKP